VEVTDGFHARKHALSKLYSYRMARVEVLSPLDRPFAVQVDRRLDVGAMNAACEYLLGVHDFTAFALAGGSHTSPLREVLGASCQEDGADIWFRVSGNGFLRGMVRSVAGTLIEVGDGRRSPDSFEELLRGAPRGAAGPTAPARGLTLEEVVYDPLWVDDASDGEKGAVVN
jgi:tRNA pseudouridine38-40 synthase